jgi:hypothetical protein
MLYRQSELKITPSIITEQAKVAGIISISFQGICGEDDFGCQRWKKARLAAGME